MRLLIVSDAWLPQVNGVVTSLLALQRELELLGHQVRVLSPADFRCLPCPSYPEIPLAWNLWRLGGLIEAFAPDAVHLATEGRSAGPRGAGWAGAAWTSPRRSIRAFPNTCVTAVRGCRCPGAMPSCAPSIGRAGRCW
ncbi:glycosyl transferase family protein [Pseudomonas aeruginosa]|nr:glycosyl transferase family protein [Pseudomonas aeruginosa]